MKSSIKPNRRDDKSIVRACMETLDRRILFAALTIAQENQLAGTPASQWDISGAGALSIQGFSTEISVNHGSTVQFKIDDHGAAPYHIDIYRLGYYQGNGARKITTIPSSQTLRIDQADYIYQASTGLVDCGNWAVSASWSVPATATSGVYIAKVVREDTGGASHITFIVRDDESHSDLLFKTSDTTWQAYNNFGFNSLYEGSPAGRAYKVSYNRPLVTRGTQYSRAGFFSNEYPMLRFLEANGYDVSYSTGVDTARSGAEILEHKTLLSVGHDEYWSAPERTNVEAARNAGVNLAFFSGNEVFWKTRWEPSIAGASTDYRTLVCYKETHANAKIDPLPDVWTGSWRDPRFSPPADGGQPENGLTGTIFMVNGLRSDTIQVPSSFSGLRFWRNTSVAQLQAGQVASLAARSLGYGWDADLDNGFRPAGLFTLSSTTIDVSPKKLLDYGSTYGAGSVTHSLTLYRANSGALVFGAGTVHWSLGLDAVHDDPDNLAVPINTAMRQATVNLFADMGAQPVTLIAGLASATKSTDAIGPASVIPIPPNSTIVTANGIATISGTATDSGGGVVGGVEVSVNGGATWHPATGRNAWSYSWAPAQFGSINIRARSTDDSANIGAAASANVTISPGTGAFSIWSSTDVPGVLNDADAQPIEVGVKFRSDVAGFITGLRFYKGSQNTGTHIGHLWTRTGTLLATATFVAETSSGWQSVSFSSPVAISANTTYVASYYTSVGHYSSNSGYFAGNSVDRGTLHALADGTDGGNGVYQYGSPSFPTDTYLAANYWVDVVFMSTNQDTAPPTLTGRSPAPGATNVARSTSVTATFSEAVQSSTISFVLRDPANNTVAGSVNYNTANFTATLTPTTPLAANTTYTATVSGAKDLAGNTISTVSWSFTTAQQAATASRIFSPSDVPAIQSANDFSPVELGMKFRSDVAGFIAGLWFYKGAQNTGTHVGSLWSSTGALLGRMTFVNETASGWQYSSFASPVAIAPNTTYVASYFTNGGYSANLSYFAAAGADNGNLHGLRDGVDGGNGVYTYASASAFPNESYQSTNYWVDVDFGTSAPPTDTTPPTITARTPANNATGVLRSIKPTVTFSDAMDPSTINGTRIVMRRGNINVAIAVTYNATTRVATISPATALAALTKYTVTVTGGASGVKDLAGNPLASTQSWSFTTRLAAGVIPEDATPIGGSLPNDSIKASELLDPPADDLALPL
ncbi:hypothetical protein BH09PLA1_BH09PLA1_12500 [soil metagenome]